MVLELEMPQDSSTGHSIDVLTKQEFAKLGLVATQISVAGLKVYSHDKNRFLVEEREGKYRVVFKYDCEACRPLRKDCTLCCRFYE